MFKERFLIGIEIPPKRVRKSYSPTEKFLSPQERAERIRELKENEEKEKEEAEQVADKLIYDLDKMGIRCPRCESRKAKEDKKLSKKDKLNYHFYCPDCYFEWKEPV